jgi:hypothetical protein
MYQYVLAWTGEQATAVDLTTSVLRTAVDRRDRLVDGADADELEVRLMALLRAAVAKRRARSGRPPEPTAVPEEFIGLFEALGRLDDTQREVLVLCDLLGQDPDRVARLLGCDREVLDGLREAGGESLWRAMNDAPEDAAVSTWQRLTVGAALRQAAGGWLHPADGAVLGYVSEQLFGEAPVGVPAAPSRRGAPKPAPAAPAAAAEAGAPAAAAKDGEGGPRELSPAAIAKANAKVGPKAAAAAAALAQGRAAAMAADAPPKATSPGAPAGAPPKPATPGAGPAAPGGQPGDGASAPVSPAAAAKAAAAKAAAKLGGPAAAAAPAARAEAAATPRADPRAQSKAAPKLQPRTGADGQPPATGNGQAKGNGGVAAAAAVAAAAGQGAQPAKGATSGEQPRDNASGGALAALARLRGRWAAWGIAAAAAAILGVVAALTLGGPVSGSPDCPSALSCLPSTTLAANGRDTLPPGPPPTDAAGNLVPTSSLAGGGFVPAPGFTIASGTSQTTTTGPDGRVPTTTSGTATTARPPKTTKPSGSTSPPTTAGPTTTDAPTTTEEPTTSSDTTMPTLPLP